MHRNRRRIDRRQGRSRSDDAGVHARDPRYGFDRHKGYATRDHLDAVYGSATPMSTVERSARHRCLIGWRKPCRTCLVAPPSLRSVENSLGLRP